jgi:hypothetical protein
VETKCRRAGRLRRNEIASSLAAACREQKIEINSAIRVLSLHYFCFAFAHACLALYVEQVNGERKGTGVCVVHGKAALKQASSARHQQ